VICRKKYFMYICFRYWLVVVGYILMREYGELLLISQQDTLGGGDLTTASVLYRIPPPREIFAAVPVEWSYCRAYRQLGSSPTGVPSS